MSKKTKSAKQAQLALLHELNETLWAFHVISKRLGRKLNNYLKCEKE